MTDEQALAELSTLFPDRTFRIQHGDQVRIYSGDTLYTVRDTLEECMEMCRWWASYIKGGPKTLKEFRKANSSDESVATVAGETQ